MKAEWIRTADGSFTKIHPSHGQSYHSLAGAYSECIEVFLKPVVAYFQNRPQDTWRVLDVGFGLGLNWICFVQHALEHGIPLEIDSLESDETLLQVDCPEGIAERVSAKALQLLAKIKNEKCFSESQITARLHMGDAKSILQTASVGDLPLKNIVLQDAFSPRVDPHLWDEGYFFNLAKRCLPDAIVATYAAAGSVQRALRGAGFRVEKQPGFAGKRERIVAFKC